MNKHILTAFLLSALALPGTAQLMPPHWQDALHQNVAYGVFARSMKILEHPLLLTIPVTKQYFDKNSYAADISYENTAQYRQLSSQEIIGTYPSTAGCKAYALDDHWVMAGATCLWNGRHTIDLTPSSASTIFATGLVEPDASKENLYVNGSAINWKDNLFIQPRENKLPHIILVRIPASTTIGRRLQRMDKINIQAFDITTPTQLTGGDFYINTARFGLNTVRKRSLTGQAANGKVTVKDSSTDLSGVSTDPLTYIKAGEITWVGVNDGITNLRYSNLAGDWDGETSNDYFYFTKEDVEFIKQTISICDPAAWQRIEKRIRVD